MTDVTASPSSAGEDSEVQGSEPWEKPTLKRESLKNALSAPGQGSNWVLDNITCNVS